MPGRALLVGGAAGNALGRPGHARSRKKSGGRGWLLWRMGDWLGGFGLEGWGGVGGAVEDVLRRSGGCSPVSVSRIRSQQGTETAAVALVRLDYWPSLSLASSFRSAGWTMVKGFLWLCSAKSF